MIFLIDGIEFVFYVCIGLGLIVPFLSLLFGFFGPLLDVELDFIDDVPADAGQAIPLNLMCLCFSLVVFGALGRLITGLMINLYVLIGLLLLLLIVSFASYIVIYKYIVKPLKRNNPKALMQWDLFGMKGKLTLRITKSSEGTVSLKDSTGAMISYKAAAQEDTLNAWDGMIPQGAEVMVVDIDTQSNTVFVKPLDTFENHKLRNHA